MRINVLHGAFLPVPPLRGGAIEKSWQALGKAFADAGHEVTHVSRLCDGLPAEEREGKLTHLRVRGADATKSASTLKLKELPYVLRARRVLPRADVLVTHAFWAPLLMPRDRNGRIYVHVGRFPKGQLKFYAKAACLQAPSQAVGKAIRKECRNALQAISVLPYPLGWPVPRSAEIQDRPKRILYAGRLHPEKGILSLLQAWKMISPKLRHGWSLRLIGPWMEEQGGGGRKFFDQIRNCADPSVEIRDPIFSENGLLEEYKDARIFAYPSMADRGETFGLAVLEAMSAGCVPLVSSLGCFSDFLRQNENGRIFRRSAPDLAAEISDALLELIARKEQLPILSKGAVETAKGYEVSTVAQRYVEDFHALLPGIDEPRRG